MAFSFVAFTSRPPPLFGVGGRVVFRAPIRLGGRGGRLGGLEDIFIVLFFTVFLAGIARGIVMNG